MTDKTSHQSSSDRQLITYLEGCALLGERPGGDGLAYVVPVALRQILALLNAKMEEIERLRAMPAHETSTLQWVAQCDKCGIKSGLLGGVKCPCGGICRDILGPIGHLRKLGWEYRSENDSLVRLPTSNHPSDVCPKCKLTTGNDWSQCGGSCPIPESPHYKQNSTESGASLPSNERCPHGISLTAIPPCNFCEHDKLLADFDRLRDELRTTRLELAQALQNALRMIGFASQLSEALLTLNTTDKSKTNVLCDEIRHIAHDASMSAGTRTRLHAIAHDIEQLVCTLMERCKLAQNVFYGTWATPESQCRRAGLTETAAGTGSVNTDAEARSSRREVTVPKDLPYYFEYVWAWNAVWDQLTKHNPVFARGPDSDLKCAVREIARLQALDHDGHG